MADDPFALFDSWFADACSSEINDPEAMALATADAGGHPSVRMVLLKGHGPDGFVFYTNQRSRKGEELAANPNAALLFHWKPLRRQIRIEGPVTIVSCEEADSYFASRSRDSKIGAWASNQSWSLPSRAEFENKYEQLRERFGSDDIPRPPHWGGFRLIPESFEFWSDRPHRLHERRVFIRAADGAWTEGLLYP